MHHIELAFATDFEGWRAHARRLALQAVPAEEIDWTVRGEPGSLLSTAAEASPADSLVAVETTQTRYQVKTARLETVHVDAMSDEHGATAAWPEDSTVPASTAAPAEPLSLRVPRSFIELAQQVIKHRDVARFTLLYRTLLRLQHEPRLLEIDIDPDIAWLHRLTTAVRHDEHRMHAYVRFRRVEQEGVVRFIAWYEPEHHIVESTAEFFVRRFANQQWSILTPERCALWDGQALHFGPGVSRAHAPQDDALEALWLTYYAHVFNPARVNLEALQGHMPRKFWSQLPEAKLIAPLTAAAQGRTGQMIALSPTKARRQRLTPFHRPTPSNESEAQSTVQLAALAQCERCSLWQQATQVVPGEGPQKASLMMVGEQPGDQEDVAGRPFVGPAGRLLDRVLTDAGIARDQVYVTNAVKHFKFELRGKRRLHKTPAQAEVAACSHWLEAELQAHQPRLVVALGATAARALLGVPVAVQSQRGQRLSRDDGLEVLITVHPSYLLRIDPRLFDHEYARWLEDLRVAAGALREPASSVK